jgi:hypothetical protein
MNSHLYNLTEALEWPTDAIIEAPYSAKCMVCGKEVYDNFIPIKYVVEDKTYVCAWRSDKQDCSGREDKIDE